MLYDVSETVRTTGGAECFPRSAASSCDAHERGLAEGEAFGSAALIEQGSVHFARNCAVCHGPLAVSSGVLPDLRWSAIAGNKDAWKGVVIDGNLAANGMVSFADYLTPDEADAIRAYVLAQAYAAGNQGGGQ